MAESPSSLGTRSDFPNALGVSYEDLTVVDEWLKDLQLVKTLLDQATILHYEPWRSLAQVCVSLIKEKYRPTSEPQIPQSVRKAMDIVVQSGGGIVVHGQPCGEKNFNEVIKYKSPALLILRGWVTGDMPASGSDSSVKEQEQDITQKLHQDFVRQYKGSAAVSFVNAVNMYKAMYSTTHHYGRTIPIIQSSATGKSRLVSELRHQIPTITVCFRTPGPDLTKGWPPGDTGVYEFFNNRTYYGEELCAAFLAALFKVVRAESEKRPGIGPSIFSDSWIIEDPLDLPASSRTRNFTKVVQTARELLQKHMKQLHKEREHLGDYADSMYRLLIKPFAEALHQTLLQRRSQDTKKDDVIFLLAFDECTLLNTMPASSKSQNFGPSLGTLRRMLKALDVTCPWLWALLLDTNSTPFDLFPSQAHSSSARFSYMHSLPIYSHIGFDVFAPSLFSDQVGPWTPAHTLKLSVLAHFGRPYWYTLKDSPQMLLQNATAKLFNRPEFQVKSKAHIFAGWSFKLQLELGHKNTARRLAIDSVAQHMRILERVTHGNMLITRAPSEPMLAIAATTSFLETQETYGDAVKALARELIFEGLLLDYGRFGKLICRLILMMARDIATLSFGPTTYSPYLNDDADGIRPIKLKALLNNLIPANVHVDYQTDANKLMKFAQTIWINFTHFEILDEIYCEVPQALLVDGWLRGMAFQCAHHQPLIDGFFVGYSGKLDEPFDPAKLLMIPWHSKAKSSSFLGDALTSLPITGGPAGHTKSQHDHVVLLMDLGTSTAFNNKSFCSIKKEVATSRKLAAPAAKVSKSAAPSSPKKRKVSSVYMQPENADNDPEPECYIVNTRGIHYRVVEDLDCVEVIREILDPNDTNPKTSSSEVAGALDGLREVPQDFAQALGTTSKLKDEMWAAGLAAFNLSNQTSD